METMRPPLVVGILVLNYRRNTWTQGCLLSLRQLRDVDYRVILMDSGSQDGSDEEFEHRCPEVDYVSIESNCGYGRGNNLGARSPIELRPLPRQGQVHCSRKAALESRCSYGCNGNRPSFNSA